MSEEITKEQALKLVKELNQDRKELNSRIENLLKSNFKLQQEKQQLIEENKKLKQWDINKDSRNSRQRIANNKVLQQRDSYKSVIDEIRKEINNNMHTYEDDGDCGVDCCCDGFELLKILDKANIKECDE